VDIRVRPARFFGQVENARPSTDERGREELLDGRGAWKNTVYVARSTKADAGVMVARSASCAYIRKHVLSLEFLNIWFILLPVCLLGGYLTGRWKWQDFEKKNPQ